MGEGGKAHLLPATWLPSPWHPANLPVPLVASLRRGVSRRGNQGRLVNALSRLKSGRGLVLTAIGASVTADFGGAVGAMQDQFALTYFGTPRRCTHECVRAGWLLPLLALLTTDPFVAGNGAAAATLVNSGQAGTSLFRYLECTGTLVPDKADVILIDAATIEYNDLKGIESVVRRLVALPHSPAVIFIHLFDWCGCQQCDHRGCGECPPYIRTQMHRNGSCYNLDAISRAGQLSSASEARINRIADFYGLPVLSVSQAFVQAALNREDGFDTVSTFTQDGLHPRRACSHPDHLAANSKDCGYALLLESLLNQFFFDVLQNSSVEHSAAELPAELPCSTLHIRRQKEQPISMERSHALERCFGWDGVEGRHLKPLLDPSSQGWRRTEQDTATSFDPPPNCVLKTSASASSANVTFCPKRKPRLTALAPGSVAVLELRSLSVDCGYQPREHSPARALARDDSSWRPSPPLYRFTSSGGGLA